MDGNGPKPPPAESGPKDLKQVWFAGVHCDVGGGYPGRRRCRMHGGADGSGAPSGPRNGNYKHGRHTKEVAATRRWLREAIDALRELKKRPR